MGGEFRRQLPCGAFLISSLTIAAVHSAALDALCLVHNQSGCLNSSQEIPKAKNGQLDVMELTQSKLRVSHFLTVGK